MKNRKDIGQLIEEQLDASYVSGKPELWKQINQELDKKKRRRMFFLWFSTATVLAILLLTTLNGYQKTSKETSVEIIGNDLTEQELTEHSSQKLEIYLQEESNEATKEISSSLDSISSNPENKHPAETNISEAPKKVRTSINTAEDNVNEFDGFEKKTTYHYYSSETNQTISSDNKKWADSILSEKTEVILHKDSIF